MSDEKTTDALNETPAGTTAPTGTLPERVERDRGKSTVIPTGQKKATKKKAAKKAKKPAAKKPVAPSTQEPPTPPAAAPAAKKTRKRRAKKVAAPAVAASAPADKAPAKKGKRGRKKNWRKGRQWPAQPFTLCLNVMTKKPKALSVAIRKLLWHYTVRAPKKGKKASA